MLCLNGQKDYKFNIILLDDREFKSNYKGAQKCEQILLDIAKILGLEEKEYFGFRFTDSEGNLQWIDLNKTIQAQFKSLFTSESSEIVLNLSVKFYITDPCKLNHEITRYFYYIQLRKDIMKGNIPVQFDFAVDLFSYFLQNELGDYNPKRDAYGYASEFNFLPNQSIELEKAAEAKHMKLKGMSQNNSEMNFLNKVKWLDFYGVDLQPVLGENNIEYFIGLTPTGISVYQNRVKINSYFWPRINKLNYKSCKFMLTVIEKTNEKTTHVFILSSKSACKYLWKSCVDQHKFFRIKTVYEEPAKLSTTRATSKNSRTSKNKSESSSKVSFKRIPAKRVPRRKVEYLTGLEEPEQSEPNKLNLNEEVLHHNGNLIFKKSSPQKNFENNQDNKENSFEPHIETSHQIKAKPSPTMSSKSNRSYKFPNPARSDLFSENDTTQHQRRKHRSSSNRRLSTSKQNNAVETDTDTENKFTSVSRRNSNTSRTSKRSRRHHRSSSRGSTRGNLNLDGQHKNGDSSRVARSRKSLTDQASAANLIKNYRHDPSETCHETTMDENDENQAERKRQIRRRKRSKSPGGTSKVPEEILQHIKYDLIEADGMSADQLKEIPFVKIETTAPPFRISPHQKRYKSKSPHRRKSGGGEFHDSKTSIAYIREANAQIAKTNKLIDNSEVVMVSLNDKKNTISTGSAINSKLNHFTATTFQNPGFSADSGCEDMVLKTS